MVDVHLLPYIFFYSSSYGLCMLLRDKFNRKVNEGDTKLVPVNQGA